MCKGNSNVPWPLGYGSVVNWCMGGLPLGEGGVHGGKESFNETREIFIV